MISKVPQITDDGKALLMRALTGESITFTRMAIGDGELAEGQDQDELHALIHEQLSITPTNSDTSQAGLIAITGEFGSADIEEDFKWTEIGIFAQGEDEREMLYAYANDGDDAGMLRVITTDILTEQTLTLIVEIDDAENVNVIYNPHAMYAPAATLTGHMNNTNNPHSVTKQQVGLGNVPNLSPSNMTVTFSEPDEMSNIGTGQKLSVMFGKIKKMMTVILEHLAVTATNPHGTTKADVGLGDVENYAPSSMPMTFTQAGTEQELTAGDLISGETTGTLFTKIATAVRNLIAHMNNTSNPHSVTATQVGLGNVSNTAPSFNVIEFDTRQQYGIPASGETMATLMSKIAKDLTDIQTHMDTTNTPNPHGIDLEKIAFAGTYTGDGSTKRGINLGFVPSAIWLTDEWGQTWDADEGVRGGMTIGIYGIRSKDSSDPADATTWDNQYTALLPGEDSQNSFAGFWVNRFVGSTAEENISTNENGIVYHYIAFR